MRSSHIQRVGPWLFAALMLWGCGNDSQPQDDTETSDTSAPVDTDADVVDTTEDTVDVDTEEVEVRYAGHPCDADEQCATGLCYGSATSQGFFEPPKCQTRCLDLFDYTRYCNSDSDCCKGRCCLGCGGKEGLCTLQ